MMLIHYLNIVILEKSLLLMNFSFIDIYNGCTTSLYIRFDKLNFTCKFSFFKDPV